VGMTIDYFHGLISNPDFFRNDTMLIIQKGLHQHS
jgi:hypothetical protein